jgi:ubiquinone/menaquinone biosynthesis C-methylase UbiE
VAPAVTRPDVPEAFDAVADRYDLMVGLSPGYHRQLRSSALHAVRGAVEGRAAAAAGAAHASGPTRLLDLGCGSGASTRAVVDAVLWVAGSDAGAGATVGDAQPAASLLGIDGSEGMLVAARGKRWPTWVRFARGRAEALSTQPELDEARAAGGLDGILAAYLVRNVEDRDALLTSVHAALRPGGVLVVHDYSVRGRPVATVVWTAVCWGVIVPLGWLTSRHTAIYRYLWRSVLDMDSTAALEQRLQKAGFVDVETRPVPGWQRGTVHSVVGRRPHA